MMNTDGQSNDTVCHLHALAESIEKGKEKKRRKGKGSVQHNKSLDTRHCRGEAPSVT